METQLGTVKILLVDDHVLFREGAARLLAAEGDCEVVGQCGGVEQAIQILASKPVDLVLLDLDLGRERGVEFFQPARSAGFSGRILVVAAVVSPFEARRLMHLGASGVLLKQGSPDLLTDAIRRLMRGELWMDPSLEQFVAAPIERKTADQLLTERERAVLKGVLEGLTNKEIASRVHISEALVKSTLQQLFEKNSVRTRSQLVRIALEQYANQL
jgi:two-component system nitrate/nitrite response regulator NarL